MSRLEKYDRILLFNYLLPHSYILILTPYISYRSEKDDLTIEISSKLVIIFCIRIFSFIDSRVLPQGKLEACNSEVLKG